MRALTLTQPWASLVAAGEKRIETRSWPTSYRGPLAIHASKGFPRDARELCVRESFAAALRRNGVTGLGLLSPQEVLPLGHVVAVAQLTNVWPTSMMQPEDKSIAIGEKEREFGNYGLGRYAWILEDVVALKRPVPARGALGLWIPGASDVAAIEAAIA